VIPKSEDGSIAGPQREVIGMSTTRASLSSGEVTRNQLSAWISREAITRVKQG
jgi:hypothetical protein